MALGDGADEDAGDVKVREWIEELDHLYAGISSGTSQGPVTHGLSILFSDLSRQARYQ